ncbi:MAG: hypothetical protein KBD21_02580 [Candidatus Pacebacteria bacterium]|nr:hypothetical protein [Candidatus Paceibacterota bacterium]
MHASEGFIPRAKSEDGNVDFGNAEIRQDTPAPTSEEVEKYLVNFDTKSVSNTTETTLQEPLGEKERTVPFEEVSPTLERVINPNSIGTLMSISRDLPVEEGKVYRSLGGSGAEAAIADLYDAGIVRNAFSAGKKERGRWGDKVFWSAGETGKYHNVQEGGYVIVADRSVAEEGPVKLESVTHIYTKRDGKVVDLLEDREFVGKHPKLAKESRTSSPDGRHASAGLENKTVGGEDEA